MRLDGAIDQLAAAQHGCVGPWQLRALGATPTEIARLRRSKRWDELAGVLILRGSAPTPEREASAAVLEAGPGAGLGFESGASWWGLGGSYRLVPAQVVRARPSTNPLTIGRARGVVGIGEEWMTRLDGISVVRPELCVYQLCAAVHPGRAERALDEAWSKGLVSGASLRACLQALRRRGRNGTRVLAELLVPRGLDYTPPASGLEQRFQWIARDAGYVELRRQVDSGGEMWTGRVDFRHVRLPLLFEIQSARYHAALSAQRDDAARLAALRAAGFVVVEVTDLQVWHDAPSVRRALHDGHRLASTLFLQYRQHTSVLPVLQEALR